MQPAAKFLARLRISARRAPHVLGASLLLTLLALPCPALAQRQVNFPRPRQAARARQSTA